LSTPKSLLMVSIETRRNGLMQKQTHKISRQYHFNTNKSK
jgi:hypothetical protein